MAVIRSTVLRGQPCHPQALLGCLQPFDRRSLVYRPGFQKTNPLIQRRHSMAVKLVNAEYVILREQVTCLFLYESIPLFHGQFQRVSRVDAFEHRFPMVDVVVPLAQVEIHDVHRVYFPDFRVLVPLVDVFRNCLRCPVQHPLEVVQLTCVLDFHKHQFTLLVLRQQVHPVEFVVLALLVPFAFQDALYFDFFPEQFAQKTFQYHEIRFLAQKALDRPVESHQLVSFVCHDFYCYCSFSSTTKIRNKLHMPTISFFICQKMQPSNTSKPTGSICRKGFAFPGHCGTYRKNGVGCPCRPIC